MSKTLTETLNLTTGEPQINTAPDTRHNIVMAPTSEEANGTMKFKIHEVKFLDDSPRTGKMELYCKIGLGWHNEEASCTKSHVITLQRKHSEETAKVTVKDRTKGILRDHIGDGHVDLNDVASKGTVTQWYNLVHGENIVAQILLTVDFIASGDTSLA